MKGQEKQKSSLLNPRNQQWGEPTINNGKGDDCVLGSTLYDQSPRGFSGLEMKKGKSGEVERFLFLFFPL